MSTKRGEPYLPFADEIYEQVGMAPDRSSKTAKSKIICDPNLLDKINRILTNMDREDFISRYKLENLPEEFRLTSDEVYRMLYFKYALAFAKYEDYYFLLPFALDGTIDIYGRFKSIKLFPYTSDSKDESGKDIKVYKNKELSQLLSELSFKVIYCEKDLDGLSDTDLKAVIIKDYVNGIDTNNGIPRYQLNKPLLETEALFIPYMRTSLKLATGVKMVGVNDPSEESDVIESLRQIDNAIISGVPFIPVIRKSDFQDIGNEPVAKVQDYFLAMQSVDNFRLSSMGLSNGGLFQKSERETISEQATNTVNANLRLQQNFEFQKKQWDLINKAFGLDIQISVRKDENQMNSDYEESKQNEGFKNGDYSDIIDGGDVNV